MSELWAIIAGLVAIGGVVAKWLYDKYKRQNDPKRKRLDYVEKMWEAERRKWDAIVKRGNLPDLTDRSRDIVDSVSRLRKQKDIDKSNP